MILYGGQMSFGPVTLVGIKSVFRISDGHEIHQAVPDDLSDNRGCSNALNLVISAHNGFSGNIAQRWGMMSIDKSSVRLDRQPVHGPSHGQKRGMKNVQPIDLLDACRSKRIRARMTADMMVDEPALALGKPLGITISPVHRILRIQHHNSGHDRSSQRTTPYLIDASDQFVVDQRCGRSHLRTRSFLP